MAPPPPQFVDAGQNYGKPKGPNQNQSLVSVPEEEESDWSEMGDEMPRFLLTGSNRFQAASAGFLPWRSEERRGGGGWPGQGDGDGDSESGGEEFVRRHPPGSLHLPHLHFTLHHHEMFPPPPDDGCPAAYRITTDGQGASGERGSSPVRLRSSPIRRRSVSLEEIAGACHHMQQEEEEEELMRGTEKQRVLEDSDNEIIHRWGSRADGDPAAGGKAQAAEGLESMDAGGSLADLHSSQRMFDHFICELRPGDAEGQRDRAEVKGWTGGLPEEVLGGERTEL